MLRQKILVTGATGFIGAAVARQLVQEGRDVALTLRPNTNTHRITDLLNHVTIIHADLNDPSLDANLFTAFSPDAAAHLAWSGVHGSDRNNPAQIENVPATVALYRAVTATGCRRIVALGSQAEYGPCANRASESTPTNPTTIYGAAKLATFWLLNRMAAVDGVSAAWLRLFSSYGPGDHPNWMIPYLINTLLRRERPALTQCEQLWDYIYVDDAAAAVVALIDNDAQGPFNLGSGEAQPLRKIVETIRDQIDPALPLGFGEVPYRPDQVMHLEADINRLRSATGWAPKMSLEEGLARTINHFRKAKLDR